MIELVSNLNNFCFKLENSYYKDNDIISILNDGVTPQNIISASKIIRDKEKSRFLKLPVNFLFQTNVQQKVSIEELPKIAEATYSGEETITMFKSIELVSNEDIMLKVLGPFSMLFENIDSNTLFKWLHKYKNEMHVALEKNTEVQAAYINSAIEKGVNIISLAEPSAIVEVVGESRYKEFVIYYTIKLLRKIEENLNECIVHICPKTSYLLEKYGYVTSEELSSHSKNYAQALIDLSSNNSIKYIGHRCINSEHVIVDKIHVLRLL